MPLNFIDSSAVDCATIVVNLIFSNHCLNRNPSSGYGKNMPIKLFEALFDAFVEKEFVSVLKNSEFSAIKDSNLDISAIRFDNRNARYGLINCDNFSLQLIMQDKIVHGTELKLKNRILNRDVDNAPEFLVSEENKKVFRNTRISSCFHFDSFDVNDRGVIHTDSSAIHFIKSDGKVISLFNNTWDVDVRIEGGKVVIREGLLTKKSSTDTEIKKTVIKKIKQWLPTSIRSLPLYQNKHALCALVELKTGEYVELGSTILKFSDTEFGGVWALLTLKKITDTDDLILRDEVNILAIGP